MDAQQQLFSIARKINTSRSKYEYISSALGFLNYRIITASEVNIRGKDIDLPNYVRSFINAHREVILIANIIRGRVVGMLLRATDDKAFMDFGFRSGSFYGLGSFDKDFTYGNPIMLVEGAIDCDVAKKFITKNCLAVLTSSVSEAKAKVLACLTDKVLLFLDNDEAGHKGEITTRNRLAKYGVQVIVLPKVARIKDLGDLLDLYMKADLFTEVILNDIRSSVMLGGGKLV